MDSLYNTPMNRDELEQLYREYSGYNMIDFQNLLTERFPDSLVRQSDSGDLAVFLFDNLLMVVDGGLDFYNVTQ